MINFGKPCILAILALALGAMAPFSSAQSAFGKNCGNLNQKPCPKVLPGPQCKKGLEIIRGVCLPSGRPDKPKKLKCGRLGQKACPKILPGPQCRSGLKVVRGICLPKGKPDKPKKLKCGGLNQKACPKPYPGPQCKSGLRNIGGICLPIKFNCGGLNQKACPKPYPGPQCKPGLRNIGGYCRQEFVIDNPKWCGGHNQPWCPPSVRVPACDPGLVKSVGHICRKPSSGGGSGGGVTETAKQCMRDFKPMGKAMLEYGACQNGLGKLEALKRAIKAKNLDDIRGIVEAAQCKDERENMIRVMRSEGFKSFSVGVSGEAQAGISGTSEFFVAMNLDLSNATTYQQVGGGLGLGGGIGLNGVVSGFFNPADDLSGGGKSFSVGGKFLAGGSAAVGLSNGKPARCESFSAAAGKGVGANFGTIALTHTHKLFRFPKIDFSEGCKNVRVIGRNKVGKKIKVIDVDFYDYLQDRWRSKATKNQTINNGGVFDHRFKKLRRVGGDSTKVKIQYRVHQGGKKWSKVKESTSTKVKCRDGMVFDLTLGGSSNYPCGGAFQRACPASKPGPQCKKGLKKVRYPAYAMCVPG